MTNDPTTRFFHELAGRGYEPLVREVVAVVRFDLLQDGRTEHWYLFINNGDLNVSTAEVEADCVIAADRSLFNRIVSGTANAMAAMLRGELIVLGEPELLIMCQRLIPGPQPSEVLV
jgi:hypothetical protein